MSINIALWCMYKSHPSLPLFELSLLLLKVPSNSVNTFQLWNFALDLMITTFPPVQHWGIHYFSSITFLTSFPFPPHQKEIQRTNSGCLVKKISKRKWQGSSMKACNLIVNKRPLLPKHELQEQKTSAVVCITKKMLGQQPSITSKMEGQPCFLGGSNMKYSHCMGSM